MARKKQEKIDVSGLSIEDIISMDRTEVAKLSRQNLASITSRLASAANKRLKNFEKSDIYSPAVEAVKESGGKFSVKGKSQGQLQSEFARAARFLGEAKTSTVKGATKVEQANMERVGASNIEESREIWRAVDRFRKSHPDIVQSLGSDRFISTVRSIATQSEYDGADSMYAAMTNVFEENYEEIMSQEFEYNGEDYIDSDFLDIGENPFDI